MLEMRLQCRECGAEFALAPAAYIERGLRALPKRCPRCADIAQQRPEVTLRNELLAYWPAVRIVSLPPAEWKRFCAQDGDVAEWRLTFKGRHYGASWQGRIDLRSPLPEPPRPGDVVSLREMESTKETCARRLVGEDGRTLGTVYVHVDPHLRPQVSSDWRGRKVAAHSDVVACVRRRYLVLGEPVLGEPAGEPDRLLLFLEAYSKTTLKGFGRQFAAELRLEAAEKAWVVEGGVRSGRARTRAALVVVPAEVAGLVGVVHREGGQEEFVAAVEAAYGGADGVAAIGLEAEGYGRKGG